MQVIIMAGGEGSRLRPLTCDRPKPMVPVINRPVMEYAIELLKKYNLTDIGVTLQYMPEEIKDYFGDGSEFGVSIKYFIEEKPLGTAGSVKNAQAYLKDTFLVISGDALTDFDLSRALSFHREKKAIATLVLTSVEVPLEYGVVITGPDGRITQFLEKPSWGEVFSDTVNTGIYVLEPEVLDLVPDDKMFDFSKDLFPILLEQGRPLYGHIAEGYWCDIGNLQQYLQAHFDVLDGKIKLPMPGYEYAPGIWAGEGTEISEMAHLQGPIVIGRNCKIEAEAEIEPYTIIGDNSVIKDNSSIKRSILWNKVNIGYGAELRGTVLCNGVQVKDRACLYEGTVVGDNTIIEEDSKVKPEVKIWPQKTLAKRTTLSTDLIWGYKGTRNLFGANGIVGEVNCEITPETASKLGAAYGSMIGMKKRVSISSDHSPASQMIKKALMAGLMSAGIEIVDLGPMITPISRYSVRVAEVKGGVHVKISPDSTDRVTLLFFNQQGSNISKGEERKLENLFMRDDFRRADSSEIGGVLYFPHMVESYIDYLINSINSDSIRDNRMRIVCGYDPLNLSSVIPSLLDHLGCEFIPITNYWGDPEERTLRGISEIASHLAGEVAAQGANLGAVIDNNGERLILIDENGNVIDEDLFLAMSSLIAFQTGKKGAFVAPVTAPSILEKMAEAFKGRVIRTKTAPQTLMEVILKQKEEDDPFDQFLMQFDAVAALVKIMEFLSREKMNLSEFVSRIPEFYVTKKATDVPWEAKGKVMRQMIEEHRGARVELLDGIKVYHENGWTLVLPDAEEPLYHVYSEGFSQEVAEELTNMYIDKIAVYRQR